MRSLDQSLPLKLLNAREAVMEHFRPHLSAHGLTEQQWRVLRALAEHNEIDVGTLSRRITLLMPSLSRMLPDLEKRGLIERRKSPDDGRLMLARLTPSGIALFREMSGESERVYKAIEKAIGAAEIGGLLAALDQLIGRLERLPRSPVSEKS